MFLIVADSPTEPLCLNECLLLVCPLLTKECNQTRCLFTTKYNRHEKINHFNRFAIGIVRRM